MTTDNEQLSIPRRLKNMLRNSTSKWKKMGKTDEPVKSSESPQEAEIKKQKEELKRQLDAFEKFKTQTSLNVDADQLTNAINNFQLYEALLFNQQGYNDGLNGVKDANVKSSANVKADFIFEHGKSILDGRIIGMNAQLAANTEATQRLDAAFAKEEKFNDAINAINKRQHRHFSWPMGVLCILAGFALMLTDFPVSIAISGCFLDLPFGATPPTFADKLFNPEILLFSLGFTFLGFYFKIFYDEYFNNSIIPKEFKIAGEETFNDKKSFNSGLIFRSVVLIGIVVLLFYVGNLRNALNTLPIESLYTNIVSIKEIFHHRLFSFIGTTIFLPIVSGICLSLGFGIFSNRHNLQSSDHKLKKLLKEKKAVEEDKTKHETVKGMLECLRTGWNDRDSKIELLSNLFSNSYFHGYKLGHRAKFGEDIYENVNAMFIDHITSNN